MPLIPFPLHQGVKEGIQIENSWKGEEKGEEPRESIREITRKMARERDGGKKQEIRIERDTREKKNKEKEWYILKRTIRGFNIVRVEETRGALNIRGLGAQITFLALGADNPCHENNFTVRGPTNLGNFIKGSRH